MVINIIGEVFDSKYADVCLYYSQYNTKGSTTSNDIMKVMDDRVFRNMLNTTSSRTSRAFMNSCGEHEERFQILTIYRAGDVCKEITFKKVLYETIFKLFQLSPDAIKEEIKFILFPRPSSCPEKIAILRSNMLCSTTLDGLLEGSRGKKGLVKAVQDSFSRILLEIGPQKLSGYRIPSAPKKTP